MWVTELLKDLSKRAKELGFPQDKRIGDWLLTEDGRVILLCDTTPILTYPPTIILSFSRCLEWFFQNGVMYVMPFICNNHSHIERGRIDCLLPRDIETRTHDEVMAKAVVARLEK